MNKNLLKKILIIIGLILLCLNFTIYLFKTNGDILEVFFIIPFETVVEFGELESILTILSTAFLFFGLTMEKETTKLVQNNNKNLIRKYNILRILGLLPFIVILSLAIFCAIEGFSLFFNTSYGIEAFFSVIFIVSLFIWPLYIIGLIIIMKSSSKLKGLKRANSCDMNEV